MNESTRNKIIANSAVIICAAVIGLAVGFLWRGKPVPQNPQVVTDRVESIKGTQAKSSRIANRRPRVRFNDDSPLATKLEQDISMSSGVVRWLYWLEALEKAKPSDFPRLVRLAQSNPTTLRFVGAKWAEVAPRHFFDTLVAASTRNDGFPVNDLGYLLFQEWPKRDPDAAVAALSATNNFGMRNAWRVYAAGAIIETDVERGLRVFADWHIGNHGPRMTAIAKWAAADPQHAAEFTLNNPAGYVSEATIEAVGKEWARSNPAQALEFAVTKHGELASKLAASALKEWAGRDLNAAAQWLAGADPLARNRLSPAFVEAWAKLDANSALTWCEDNLAGSSLVQAVTGVLKGAAAKDVAGAAALVAGMNPSTARAEAAAAVARKWFPDSFSGRTVKPDTIAWLTGLDGDSVKRVLDEITWTWSATDPKTMAAFLEGLKREEVPSYSYTVVARELARNNPAGALEWANRLSGEGALSAGGAAFAEWRTSQPEAATKWLDQLPTGDKRRDAFFKSAIETLAWHPQAAEQLASMSGTERALAKTVLEKMRLPDDHRTKLLAAVSGQ
jgi:hypothetical protein